MKSTARGERPEHVVSITATRRSAVVDQRSRRNRYLVSMAIRTVCFLLAIVVTGPLRWVLIAGAVLLPYVAVVMANAGREREGEGPVAPGVPTPLAVEDRASYDRGLGGTGRRGPVAPGNEAAAG